MLTGEQVIVTTRHEHGYDPGGDPIYEDDPPETVDDVLVDTSTENDIEATRPDGIRIDCTLRFPRAWPYRSLRGARIRMRGNDYRVIGDPQPIYGGITPTRWNLTVQLHDERG
jgi:hypothetical protein